VKPSSKTKTKEKTNIMKRNLITSDRHPRIDNDGGRLENGPPVFPQQIDIASTIGDES
jgi:hypothetical protein